MRHVFIVLLVSSCLAQGAVARTWLLKPDGGGDAPSIRAAVDSAQAGDVIMLACGEYFEGGILLKSGLTLISETGSDECVTLIAPAYGSGLRCQDTADVHVEGLTFAGFSRAAIRLSGASARIENCRFVNNSFSDGGAIHMIDSEVKVAGCTFENNHSWHAGGAIAMGHSTARLVSCSFRGNVSQYGGAVDVESLSTLTISECRFTDNAAAGNGGALYVWRNQGSSTIEVHGSTLVDNIAPAGSNGWADADCTLIFSDSDLGPDPLQTVGGPGRVVIDGVVPVFSKCWGSWKADFR